MIIAFRNFGSYNELLAGTDNLMTNLFQNSFSAFQSFGVVASVEEIVSQLGENVEIMRIHVVSCQVKHQSSPHLSQL